MKLPSVKILKNNSFLHLLKLSVAFSLITFLILSIGIKPIIQNLSDINIALGVVLLFCNTFLLFIGAVNVWLFLNIMNPIPLTKFIKVYSYSWTLSLLTPGQLGDISLLFFLKKYSITLQRAGIAYTLDKIITLGVFFFVAWYGYFRFIPQLKESWLPFFTIFLILFIILLIFIKIKYPLSKFPTNKFKKTLSDVKDEHNKFKKKWGMIIINLILTVIKWLVLSLCYMMAFLAFNVYVEWPEIGIIPVLSTLVGYIPISIGGIGTVELTATHLFSKIGVEESIVLSAYLLLRSLQFILAIILLGFFSLRKSDHQLKLPIDSSS